MVGACSRCKLKKLKCNGQKPLCSRCRNFGLKSCDYPSDKRVDKRRVLNGQNAFVFKHLNDRGRASQKLIHLNEPRSTLLATSSELFASSSPNFRYADVLLPPDPLSMQTWSESKVIGDLPCDFDIDNFFRYLDGSLTIEPADLPAANYDLNNVYEVYDEEEISRKEIINAVFDNEAHIPPSVSRVMVELIAIKTQLSDDESFLLFTVLAIGALTLAKRKFAEQRTQQMVSNEDLELHLRAPMVASEAYNYFLQARKLLPSVIENPTKHGFRGLSLISNFMTMLLTIKAQKNISNHALQVAVSIGLDKITVLDSHSEDNGLVIAFWEIWCSACMLSSFHGGPPPPVRREDIRTILDLKCMDELSSFFFQLRVQLAEFHWQVATLANTSEAFGFDDLRRAMEPLMQRMANLEDHYASDERTFKRHELFVLELKCWKSQLLMHSGLSDLMLKKSTRAFVEARCIIKELWSFYNPVTLTEGTLLARLDWNFTYHFEQPLCVHSLQPPFFLATLSQKFTCPMITLSISWDERSSRH